MKLQASNAMSPRILAPLTGPAAPAAETPIPGTPGSSDVFLKMAQAEVQRCATQGAANPGAPLPWTSFDVRPGCMALETMSPEAMRLRMARLAQPSLAAAKVGRGGS